MGRLYTCSLIDSACEAMARQREWLDGLKVRTILSRCVYSSDSEL